MKENTDWRLRNNYSDFNLSDSFSVLICKICSYKIPHSLRNSEDEP